MEGSYSERPSRRSRSRSRPRSRSRSRGRSSISRSPRRSRGRSISPRRSISRSRERSRGRSKERSDFKMPVPRPGKGKMDHFHSRPPAQSVSRSVVSKSLPPNLLLRNIGRTPPSFDKRRIREKERSIAIAEFNSTSAKTDDEPDDPI